MISRLNAAELAAMTVAPKELIADCMIKFEMEKTQLCRPAGKPIRNISFKMGSSKWKACQSIWVGPSVFFNIQNKMVELITLDVTVAMATPSTLRPNPTTNTRFKTTLVQPDRIKTINGVFVLP